MGLLRDCADHFLGNLIGLDVDLAAMIRREAFRPYGLFSSTDSRRTRIAMVLANARQSHQSVSHQNENGPCNHGNSNPYVCLALNDSNDDWEYD
ncbi:MAG: hypothetical protein MUP44_05895 [Anaerolineales bacterium]|nr:hypothetical protein [Anaerolineales bacterium]